MRKIFNHRHKYLMWFWIAMIPFAVFTPLKESLLFVILMSLYANIESSAAANEAQKEKK